MADYGGKLLVMVIFRQSSDRWPRHPEHFSSVICIVLQSGLEYYLSIRACNFTQWRTNDVRRCRREPEETADVSVAFGDQTEHNEATHAGKQNFIICGGVHTRRCVHTRENQYFTIGIGVHMRYTHEGEAVFYYVNRNYK